MNYHILLPYITVFFAGMFLGCIIEAKIQSKGLVNAKDLSDNILDSALHEIETINKEANVVRNPNVIVGAAPIVKDNVFTNTEVKSAHDHPILGHVPYKVTLGNELKYEGYDSDQAYLAWKLIETESGAKYYIGDKLHASQA